MSRLTSSFFSLSLSLLNRRVILDIIWGLFSPKHSMVFILLSAVGFHSLGGLPRNRKFSTVFLQVPTTAPLFMGTLPSAMAERMTPNTSGSHVSDSQHTTL